QPLGVGRAGVNERGQAEGRHEDVLAAIRIALRVVHMALDVAGGALLGPAPVGHGLAVDLELAGGGLEAFARGAGSAHADGLAILDDRAIVAGLSAFGPPLRR